MFELCWGWTRSVHKRRVSSDDTKWHQFFQEWIINIFKFQMTLRETKATEFRSQEGVQILTGLRYSRKLSFIDFFSSEMWIRLYPIAYNIINIKVICGFYANNRSLAYLTKPFPVDPKVSIAKTSFSNILTFSKASLWKWSLTIGTVFFFGF